MKRSLLAASAAATSLTPAGAAIIDVDFGAPGLSSGVVITQNAEGILIDWTSGAYRIADTFGATEFAVVFARETESDPGVGAIGANSKSVFRTANAANGILERYGYGQSLNQVYATQSFGYLADVPAAPPWQGFEGVAFVGFNVGANEGWLAVDFHPNGPEGYLEVLQMQFGDAGEQLTTPTEGTYAIPEPATAAILLGGSAAVFALRRRRRG